MSKIGDRQLKVLQDCDNASLRVSLKNHSMISIGNHQIGEKDLKDRIIDKIPKAQFHKIIMAIKADLDKGV